MCTVGLWRRLAFPWVMLRRYWRNPATLWCGTDTSPGAGGRVSGFWFVARLCWRCDSWWRGPLGYCRTFAKACIAYEMKIVHFSSHQSDFRSPLRVSSPSGSGNRSQTSLTKYHSSTSFGPGSFARIDESKQSVATDSTSGNSISCSCFWWRCSGLRKWWGRHACRSFWSCRPFPWGSSFSWTPWSVFWRFAPSILRLPSGFASSIRTVALTSSQHRRIGCHWCG